MSLKDDFLEALRSVKRDFVKDYETEEARPTEQYAAPPQETFREPAPAREREAFYPRPPEPPRSSAPAQPVESAFSLSQPTMPQQPPAMRDNMQPELHTPSAPGTPNFASSAQVHTAQPEPDLSFYSPPEPGVPSSYPSEPSYNTDEPYSTSSYTNYTNSANHIDENDPPVGSRFTMDHFENSDTLGDERTIISKNTVIRGALQTDDSVRMFGQVLGDIDCSSNILVAGKVRGNTSAANAYIINAQVDGNVLCDDVVNVTDDAWILGNIRAQQADIDGKIKGNIEIRHSISIGSNSSVIGNISTDELEIRRGAFVNGQIMMYSPSRDVIDRFERFDQ